MISRLISRTERFGWSNRKTPPRIASTRSGRTLSLFLLWKIRGS